MASQPLPLSISPARVAAFSVLREVEENHGYASDLLLPAAASLSSRDAGLAHEIVLGSLRFQSQLDFLIQRWSGRAARDLHSEVRIALRMGIYQLRYLERIPRHAAVSESVELIKRSKRRSAAGLVNAVLRKVTREPVTWPDRARELVCPGWLLDRWISQFGLVVATKVAGAWLAPPATYLRVPPGASVPATAVVEPTDVPGCVRLVSGDPGSLRRQDIGSQTLVPLLDLQPGQTFLDLCAAPGNKTAQALEVPVRAVACDRYDHRLAALKGLKCAKVVLDGTQPLPFAHRFDRILVDAPCSGTGTLGRNPEIKWRIEREDILDLAIRQRALVLNALEHLAPGGCLVYATCSLEREENESVVAAVLAATGRKLLFEHRRTPGIDPGDGFYGAVIA